MASAELQMKWVTSSSEEGAVIASGGELENAEQMANTVLSTVTCITKAQLWPGDSGDAFKKISITYTDHSYVICLSNKNIHIVKRRFVPHEPAHQGVTSGHRGARFLCS